MEACHKLSFTNFALPSFVILMVLLTVSHFLPVSNATESYPYELSVILYTSGPTEYSETQNVQLLGQVTETYGSATSGENIVSVANIPYQILDADNGNVITTGTTDQSGEFQFQWTAGQIDGKSNVNLIAESNGWKSKPLSLEIYPLQHAQPAPSSISNPPPPTSSLTSQSTAISDIGNWITSSSYPDFSSGNCVTSNGYIYCVGVGFHAAYFAPLSSSGIAQWSGTTNEPEPLSGQSCVTYGDEIYCVGGSDAAAVVNDVYYASLSSSGVGQWSSTTNYPISIFSQSCVTNSGYVYCIGGGTGTDETTNVYYAPLSSSGVGQWSSTTNYPIPTLNPYCVANSGYVYCIGGGTGMEPGNSVYYAPLSSSGVGQWSSTTNYPENIRQPTCFSDSDYVYCIGGWAPNLTDTAYYAPLSSSGVGQWSSFTNYPIPILNPNCVAYSSNLYCVGGETGAGSTSTGTENAYFAPVTNQNNMPSSTAGNAEYATNPSESSHSITPITISHVTPITTNTHDLIYIEGNGFGDTLPQTAQLSDGSVLTQGCNSNSPSIAIMDKGSGNDTWPAGWYCNKTYLGGIGLYIAKWSNTEIVLNGFGSALGTNNLKTWNINSGDPITIAIFGPNQQGKATYQLTVGSPIEENNSTQTQGTATNPNASYQVTFTESGLQQHCMFWIFGCSLPEWSVTLDENLLQSSSTSVTFSNVAEGQHTYSITTPDGYSSVQSGGILQIRGDVNQQITFNQNQ